jgi:hypothetical protein
MGGVRFLRTVCVVLSTLCHGIEILSQVASCVRAALELLCFNEFNLFLIEAC